MVAIQHCLKAAAGIANGFANGFANGRRVTRKQKASGERDSGRSARAKNLRVASCELRAASCELGVTARSDPWISDSHN